MRLVGYTLRLLELERASVGALCAALGVAPPPDWPPPLFDAGALAWFIAQLRADPAVAPWLGNYVVADIASVETLVGSAGFKGPPDADGNVEIGYSIVDAFQRRGFGRQAVGLLLDRARNTMGVRCVRAETTRDAVASRGLLAACGFRYAGERPDADDGELALYALDLAAGR
ncbi:GNAT family N-acetyltransferase [Devosia sp.]|uniref:GNAT family N-acetyltransferase n=1 Tax=Devosia sp. TaxID=1871048 RepID=UPI003A920260